ncbi:hypothetical protein JSO19_05765 [Leucobacter sp. UCMA 4100]|nr:hypothetical protein [Leucobacter sp. UCMA 4100]
MTGCDECAVQLEGAWARCPLCGADAAAGGAGASGVAVARPDPLPSIPLAFSRRRLFRALFLTSLAMIVLSLAAQLLFSGQQGAPGALRIVWLAIVTLWLVTIMAVRKRHNLAKGTLYLVVIVSAMSVYWDYLTGWHGWSLSFTIPIVCGSSILALMITVQLTRIEVGDHILYTVVTVLLGLAPIVFLVLGWVSTSIPSLICGSLSVITLALLQTTRGAEVRHELKKRLNV